MTSAIASAGMCATSDLEAHREAVYPNQVRFDQLSPGPFASQIHSIQARGLMLYREQWNQRLHVTGTNPDGHLLVGVTASPGVVWRGETISPHQLFLNDASAELEFSTGPTADHLVLLVPTDLLIRHVGEELGAAMQAARRPWRCDPQSIASLAGTVQRLLDRHLANGDLLGNDHECAALEYELFAAVAQVCADENALPGSVGKLARRRALLRAIKYTNDLRSPIRLPDLVAEVGISQRNLEYAFQEAFGITPVRYLRWSRMNHVRRELLAAEPGSTTITRAAAFWGFSDMGRLAVEYRHLFGESPSATLARALPPAILDDRPSPGLAIT